MSRLRFYMLSRKTLGNIATLGLLALWYFLLAPTVLGGPAAYIEVSGHSMDGTYKTGDLVITRAQDSYAEGDIVAFKVQSGGQVIHRIVGGDGKRGYVLQGDNNPHPDAWHPVDEQVVGKAWMHFPQAAYLLDLPRNPLFAGISAGLLTLVILAWDARPRGERSGEDRADFLEQSTVPGAGPERRRRGTPASVNPKRKEQQHAHVA